MLNHLIAKTLPYLPKSFVWLFSKKYIAGTTISDALKVATALNANNIRFTLDELGEFITDMAEAEANKNSYLATIEQTQAAGANGNYSLKPTMFGLLINKEKCYNHLREIVALAASHNNFVRIDMEDSSCVDSEIELYSRLKAEFPHSVGLVLQAYLKRTTNDLKQLLTLHSPEMPLNFRLCKGIYVESPTIAYKQYHEINEHYLQNLEFMLANKIYVAIATHDFRLVERAYQLIDKYKVQKNDYEFQMLYGVTPDLRASIVAAGHTMRVYVPFGKNWFGYSTRRLKENPKIAGEIVKAIFIRK